MQRHFVLAILRRYFVYELMPRIFFFFVYIINTFNIRPNIRKFVQPSESIFQKIPKIQSIYQDWQE